MLDLARPCVDPRNVTCAAEMSFPLYDDPFRDITLYSAGSACVAVRGTCRSAAQSAPEQSSHDVVATR